jgi:hypothetical protein
MAYSGLHNPENVSRRGRTRPNPDSWEGGAEDFETVWTLKGHVLPPSGSVDVAEAAKISRNHNRLDETPGFCD